MKILSTFNISNSEGTRENVWDIEISNNGLKTNKQTNKKENWYNYYIFNYIFTSW